MPAARLRAAGRQAEAGQGDHRVPPPVREPRIARDDRRARLRREAAPHEEASAARRNCAVTSSAGVSPRSVMTVCRRAISRSSAPEMLPQAACSRSTAATKCARLAGPERDGEMADLIGVLTAAEAARILGGQLEVVVPRPFRRERARRAIRVVCREEIGRRIVQCRHRDCRAVLCGLPAPLRLVGVGALVVIAMGAERREAERGGRRVRWCVVGGAEDGGVLAVR